MNQLDLKIVVYLGPEPSHCNLDNVGIAVEVHIPNLGGDKRLWQHLPSTTQQKTYPEYDRLWAGGVEPGKVVISMIGGVLGETCLIGEARS